MKCSFGIRAGFLVLSTALSLVAVDWPQWRGPERLGVSQETGLLKEWPKPGHRLVWQRTDLNKGYSTPSIAAGRVYVLSNRGDEEFAIALDEQDGKSSWSVRIGKVG